MSFRARVIALGAVFIVLLAALLVGIFVSPRGALDRASAALLFPGLKAEKVLAVEINGPSGRLLISRSANGNAPEAQEKNAPAAPKTNAPAAQVWLLDMDGRQLPTAPERVDGLLRLIAAMQRGTLVTRDAKAAEGLGLSPAEASRLILSGAGGAKLCELTVGRQGTSGGSYIRVGDGAEVFQTGEGLAGYLSSQRATWLDLRVLPRDVRPEAVMRISVKSNLPLPNGKGPSRIDYTLLKEKDSSGAMSWSLVSTEMRGAGSLVGKLDQQAVGSLVSAVVGLEGTDILPAGDAAATGLSVPAAQVTISLTDNRTLVIAVGSRTQEGQYPCVLKDSASVFLVAEWRIQGVLVPKEKLVGQAR